MKKFFGVIFHPLVLASLALVTLVLKYIVERRVHQQLVLAQANGVSA